MTTKEQVMEWANQAGLWVEGFPTQHIERFATLVRNSALEDAAQRCMEEVADFHSSNESRDTAETLAQRIRNLKETT